MVSYPLKSNEADGPPLLPAISTIWPTPSIAMKSWPGRVEMLSPYLGSFRAGGVWPVIICAAEKPACYAV
jgi:hypothetical protein